MIGLPLTSLQIRVSIELGISSYDTSRQKTSVRANKSGSTLDECESSLAATPEVGKTLKDKRKMGFIRCQQI